jgi:hypothetical protein
MKNYYPKKSNRFPIVKYKSKQKENKSKGNADNYFALAQKVNIISGFIVPLFKWTIITALVVAFICLLPIDPHSRSKIIDIANMPFVIIQSLLL